MQNSTYTKLNFTAGINFTVNTTLENILNLTNNSIYINSTRTPELNVSAIITSILLNMSDPKIQVRSIDSSNPAGFIDCPISQCQMLTRDTASQTLVYNVTHFTSYRAEDMIVSTT